MGRDNRTSAQERTAAPDTRSTLLRTAGEVLEALAYLPIGVLTLAGACGAVIAGLVTLTLYPFAKATMLALAGARRLAPGPSARIRSLLDHRIRRLGGMSVGSALLVGAGVAALAGATALTGGMAALGTSFFNGVLAACAVVTVSGFPRDVSRVDGWAREIRGWVREIRRIRAAIRRGEDPFESVQAAERQSGLGHKVAGYQSEQLDAARKPAVGEGSPGQDSGPSDRFAAFHEWKQNGVRETVIRAGGNTAPHAPARLSGSAPASGARVIPRENQGRQL